MLGRSCKLCRAVVPVLVSVPVLALALLVVPCKAPVGMQFAGASESSSSSSSRAQGGSKAAGAAKLGAAAAAAMSVYTHPLRMSVYTCSFTHVRLHMSVPLRLRMSVCVCRFTRVRLRMSVYTCPFAQQ